MNLLCPLCCGQSFDSKSDLIEHLSKYSRNLSCPLCNDIFSTISLLLEHLLTNCSLVQDSVQDPQMSSELIQNEPNYQEKLYQPADYKKDTFFNEVIENKMEPNRSEDKDLSNDDESVENHDISEMSGVELDNKMYEELLDSKTYQSADLHSLEKNGHSDYTIITRNGLPPIISDNDVITNQSLEGALISISTNRDPLKNEPEPIITVMEKDPESMTSDEGYSCNSCGISFTSVLDHIQSYHKDQDVVIEMNDSQSQDNVKTESIEFVSDKNPVQDNIPTSMPIVFNTVLNSNLKVPEQWMLSKRVITDTGDIVVASVSDKVENTVSTVPPETPLPAQLLEVEVPPLGKKTRRYKRRAGTNGTDLDGATKKVELPYHQVVIKEVTTMNGSDKMKVYNCIICDIYVTDLDEFRAHPCKDLKYKCPNCPVSYESAKSLCAHMKAHKTLKVTKPQTNNARTETSSPLPAVGEIFKCNVCMTVFPTNKSLKLHKRMHYPVKSRPIEAPVEENQEPSKEEPEKYFCSKCNKLIPVVYRAVHSEYHGNAETYTCDICNKKFGSSSYLVMHMTVHNIDKAPIKKSDKSLPYTCLYCNRNFARPHEKVKHERIHTGEKPHSCEICGKSFRVSYCLTLHMRTHTGARPYACQHCGKRFKAHSVYNHHLLTHSDVRAYKCPYCQKAFKTSVQLAGHKNSHTKPFSCTVCNRPFASLYAVRVHTDTHRRANNLKFACALCGASYARSFALKDHVRTQHNDQTTYDEDKSWQGESVNQAEEPKKENLEIDISVFDINAAESEMIV